MMTPGSALPSKRASGEGKARVGLYGIVKKMWHCTRSTETFSSPFVPYEYSYQTSSWVP